VTAFYDIDTPVTLRRLGRGETDYVSPALVPRYSMYLSFTGGPTLELIESRYRAAHAWPLYCSCDPSVHRPEPGVRQRFDLGFLGTYSADRQPVLDELLLAPARQRPRRRFVVAGPQFPDTVVWPRNVGRVPHLAPARHRRFYASQRYTLNVTRADMVRAGWSPSVRLFEAAACATPIVTDAWKGLEAVFDVGREVLVARGAADVLAILEDLPERERAAIGRRARARVLAEHSAAHRARELLGYVGTLRGAARGSTERAAPAAVGSRAAP
jgi:spore maturation protein CgeB